MRRFARRAAAALALAGVACFGVPTAPEFPNHAPSTFELDVGGFGFGSHSVSLVGDTLVVVRRPDFGPEGARTTRVVPTRADWAEFWRAADGAGVRAWPRECRNTDILDGGGFSLRIAWAAGSVEASGGNSYPRRTGRCNGSPDRSAEFTAFLAAVSRLIAMSYP